MIGATFTRALVILAAVAGTLAPVGWPVACLAEGAPALPEKATRELPAALLSLEAQKKMPKLSPILLRNFWRSMGAGIHRSIYLARATVPRGQQR